MNPQTIIAWTLTICLAYFLLILCCAFERYINECFERRKTGKNFEKRLLELERRLQNSEKAAS